MTLGHRVAVLRDGRLQQCDTAARAVRPPGEHVRGRLHRLAGDEPLPRAARRERRGDVRRRRVRAAPACARTGARASSSACGRRRWSSPTDGIGARSRRSRSSAPTPTCSAARSAGGAARLVARATRAARPRAASACALRPGPERRRTSSTPDTRRAHWHVSADAATPPLLRALNERTVLEAIRAGAPISRAEISRRVGISKPTVSWRSQSLLEAGLVREADSGTRGPKYGATFFEPVARGGARARARPRRALPARRDLRPARRRCARGSDDRDCPAPTRRGRCGGGRAARPAGRPRPACPPGLDGAVAGVPGVIESPAARIAPGRQHAGPGGPRDRPRARAEPRPRR